MNCETCEARETDTSLLLRQPSGRSNRLLWSGQSKRTDKTDKRRESDVKMIIVKAFANYGFAGTDMEFEEEFPDDATDEEIEEVMKDIVYEQVDWSWRKEE